MRYMRNLRHLFLEGCSSLSEIPPSIGELASLKTLSLFILGHEESNQLKELEFLNLRGRLYIEHLERVKDVVDAKKANLVQKQNLCELGLAWDVDNASKSREDVDEKVIEALQPHPNIKCLWISGFKGSNFPLWMRISTLENIVRMAIQKCPNCLRLPQVLGELPHVKWLVLTDLAVQYITADDIPGVNSLTPKFPSLEYLALSYLPSLKGLLKEEVVEMFPSLQKLSIDGCSSLILPKLPSLKELYLFSCSNVTLSSFAKLDNLTSPTLEIDENMKRVPKEILEKICLIVTL